MAINKENIKLYESQRLSDEGDGGGRTTGHEVIDGQVNNLFRDISRIDRTVGDVSMRKVFVGVVLSIPRARPMSGMMPVAASRVMWCLRWTPTGTFLAIN